jgi:TatD DNase family protein
MLIDSHCHIHEIDYPLDINEVVARAKKSGVMQIICVGSNQTSSREALNIALSHDGLFASIGVHPHYAKDGIGDLVDLIESADKSKLVAIGEIGLDYHYKHSSHEVQIQMLKQQIKLAIKYDLPIIFHVREAYDDFWPIIDEFLSCGYKLRGVLHSFSDTLINAQEGIKRGLYIGVNGISTFTKDESQKIMFKSIPVERLLLETDAPFLVPNPLRGKVKTNEPAFIKEIAEYNCLLYQISFDEFSNITTSNTNALFMLKSKKAI